MLFKKKITEVSLSNDIKYKAPLSYREMRVLAWILVVLSQVAVIFATAAKYLDPVKYNLGAFDTASTVLSIIGSLSISLFLVANFSLILRSRQGIIQIIRNNALFALLIYLLFTLFYQRYLTGLFGKTSEGKEAIDSLVFLFFSKNLTLNVFIDLFVFSTFYFFLAYDPKAKCFEGKKIVWFRLLMILPILYEVASIVIKGLVVANNAFKMPVMIFPLLTTKPNCMFLAFIALAIFLKVRKNYYLKKGGTNESYDEFLKTNYNTFSFSIVVAVIFIVAGVLDIIITGIFTGVYQALNPTIDITTKTGLNSLQTFIKGWGFGKGITMILFAPIVLLFSYTKEHNPKWNYLDIIIPLIGVCACILVYIEGYYDIIMAL